MKIMTEEYCRQCPFFVEHIGYRGKDDPYWKEHPAECACKECPDREHCEQYGPKTLLECMKSEMIRRHGVSKGERAMSHFAAFLQYIE